MSLFDRALMWVVNGIHSQPQGNYMFRQRGLFSDIPWFFKLWMVFCFSFAIGMPCFIIWAIVKVMQHFHII